MDRKGFDLLRRRLVRHVTLHRFAFFWARAGRGIKPYYFAIAPTVITAKAGIHKPGLSRKDCVHGATPARERRMVARSMVVRARKSVFTGKRCSVRVYSSCGLY